MTRIEVTQDDIDRGVIGDGDCCPIALAMRRRWPNVSVGTRAVYLSGMRMTELPREARHFIVDYDLGEPVYPFSFDVVIL
jgi:hypothetical protein